jgi:hypothetical protein
MHETAQTAHHLAQQLQAQESVCLHLRLAAKHEQADHLQAWIDTKLKPPLQHAEEAASSLTALENLERYFADTGEDRDEEKSQQLWAMLPLNRQEMIVQKSPAWLALRSRHFFTGSTAFSLLLCGTGGNRYGNLIQRYCKGAWMSYAHSLRFISSYCHYQMRDMMHSLSPEPIQRRALFAHCPFSALRAMLSCPCASGSDERVQSFIKAGSQKPGGLRVISFAS